jgi:hypothetical protein
MLLCPALVLLCPALCGVGGGEFFQDSREARMPHGAGLRRGLAAERQSAVPSQRAPGRFHGSSQPVAGETSGSRDHAGPPVAHWYCDVTQVQVLKNLAFIISPRHSTSHTSPSHPPRSTPKVQAASAPSLCPLPFSAAAQRTYPEGSRLLLSSGCSPFWLSR